MRAVRIWLYVLALLVFAMVLLGGATRLTDSGLSITEWQPLLGAIPPLSDLDWQQLFAKYRLIPEYSQINKGMNLEEFKWIFWWEWSHRFLGRLVGIALLVPWILFAVFKSLPRTLHIKLFGLLLLGGFQGFLGWYMVKSGLVDRVDVSQYRLAIHLLMAALILGAILWVAFSLIDERDFDLVLPLQRFDLLSGGGLVVLLFGQIGLGALVAGLHAGLSHNSWPLMDGDFIPEGLFMQTPWFVNLFENIITVQFDHRMLAYLIAIVVLVHGFMLIRKSGGLLQSSAVIVLVLSFAQIILGIATLLLVVPFGLALAHQGLAFVAFAAAVRHFYLLQAAFKTH